MDIVTHALMGLALAAPLLPTAPLTAGCFVLGSVLPDLDAFSRCFGRRAFLRCHQTYTHGVPVALLTGATAWLALPPYYHEPYAPCALAGGMVLHAVLDVTNTYGTAILSPFSARRFCTEWIFFIDAFVTAVSVLALLLHLFSTLTPSTITLAYASCLAAYWIAKALLRTRAFRHAPPDTLSFIPSALIPWHYFGCADRGGHLQLFRANALTAQIRHDQAVTVHDATYGPLLAELIDYRTMLSLSPAYRVTNAVAGPDGTILTCRDLRIRNFGGRFGELTVTIAPTGQIIGSHLNV